MSFPFAKPTSMTCPNGGHRRQGDFTKDLRVLVIATTSAIVATAGVIAGVVLLQLIGRYRSFHLPPKVASRVLLQTTSSSPSKSMNVAARSGRARAH
jgi:hypothetical protein